MFLVEFLLGQPGNDGVHSPLLNTLYQLPPLSLGPGLNLPHLPRTKISPQLGAITRLVCLVTVNIGNVTLRTVLTLLTVMEVLEVLEVVTALTGLEVSSAPRVWPLHQTEPQPGNFSLECDGQHVLLSSLSPQSLLFPSVLQICLTLNLLILLLTGIFSLLNINPIQSAIQLDSELS